MHLNLYVKYALSLKYILLFCIGRLQISLMQFSIEFYVILRFLCQQLSLFIDAFEFLFNEDIKIIILCFKYI